MKIIKVKQFLTKIDLFDTVCKIRSPHDTNMLNSHDLSQRLLDEYS